MSKIVKPYVKCDLWGQEVRHDGRGTYRVARADEIAKAVVQYAWVNGFTRLPE